ncbi:MAG TPA: hypothetical protein VIT68_01145 [Candidatus Gracilibacteria bacterium]
MEDIFPTRPPIDLPVLPWHEYLMLGALGLMLIFILWALYRPKIKIENPKIDPQEQWLEDLMWVDQMIQKQNYHEAVERLELLMKSFLAHKYEGILESLERSEWDTFIKEEEEGGAKYVDFLVHVEMVKFSPKGLDPTLIQDFYLFMQTQIND